MGLRWGRLVQGAVAAELIPILLLITLVAVFGPPDQAQAQAYAARLGQWVGPLAGALMCFLAAWWVTASPRAADIRHGLVLGTFAALLDVTLLVASGSAFQWLFVFSNLGRVLAGALGGAVGARTPRPDR
jgi:hypothetical protein